MRSLWIAPFALTLLAAAPGGCTLFFMGVASHASRDIEIPVDDMSGVAAGSAIRVDVVDGTTVAGAFVSLDRVADEPYALAYASADTAGALPGLGSPIILRTVRGVQHYGTLVGFEGSASRPRIVVRQDSLEQSVLIQTLAAVEWEARGENAIHEVWRMTRQGSVPFRTSLHIAPGEGTVQIPVNRVDRLLIDRNTQKAAFTGLAVGFVVDVVVAVLLIREWDDGWDFEFSGAGSGW